MQRVKKWIVNNPLAILFAVTFIAVLAVIQILNYFHLTNLYILFILLLPLVGLIGISKEGKEIINGVIEKSINDDKFTPSGFIRENGNLLNVVNIFLVAALFFKQFAPDNNILALGGNVLLIVFFIGSFSIIDNVRKYNDYDIKQPYSKLLNVGLRYAFVLTYIAILSIVFTYILLTPAFSDVVALVILIGLIAIILLTIIFYSVAQKSIWASLLGYLLMFIAVIGAACVLLGWISINGTLSINQSDIASFRILNYSIPTVDVSTVIGIIILAMLLDQSMRPKFFNNLITKKDIPFWGICITIFFIITIFLLTTNYGTVEQNTIIGTWVDHSNNDTIYYRFDNNHIFTANNSSLVITGRWLYDYNNNRYEVTIDSANPPIQTNVYLNKTFSNITLDSKPLQAYIKEVDKNNYIYKLH